MYDELDVGEAVSANTSPELERGTSRIPTSREEELLYKMLLSKEDPVPFSVPESSSGILEINCPAGTEQDMGVQFSWSIWESDVSLAALIIWLMLISNNNVLVCNLKIVSHKIQQETLLDAGNKMKAVSSWCVLHQELMQTDAALLLI